MTAQDWLTDTDPLVLVEALRDRAEEAQLRLFAVAACELLGDSVDNYREFRDVVNRTKRYAQGKGTTPDWARLRHLVMINQGQSWEGDFHIACAVEAVAHSEAASAARDVVRSLRLMQDTLRKALQFWLERSPKHPEIPHFQAWLAHIADPALVTLVREMFANPWRTWAIPKGWLTWKDGTVKQLAQTIQKKQDFASFPILGDALAEAGCTDEEILAHCRLTEHRPECWLLRLLLPKRKRASK